VTRISKEEKVIDIKVHQQLAKQLFNQTWNLLDNSDRTSNEDLKMIHTAHASRYHWGILVSNGLGTPLNLQRGEWLISHVYTILKRAESAFFHAKVCIDLTEKYNIRDFDLAFAYEAMARSSALAKNEKDFKKYYKLAESMGKEIKEDEDRKYFFDQLNSGQWFGLK
jgi:hypothetical protein